MAAAIPVLPTSDLGLPVAALARAGRSLELPTIEGPRAEPPHTATASESTESADVSQIRRALQSYEHAYERLDVAAAVAVWPSVDRRALSRAFGALKSQGVDFQTCSITVDRARATARCSGTLQIVRRVGNPLPLTAEQQWLFEMRRDRAAWTIDKVLTSQSSAAAEEPARDQG